jgi:hypothetical protein
MHYKFYGITQDPKKENYMMVLSCKEQCNDICNTIRFQQNFKSWASGNKTIDKFIQDTQLSEHTSYVRKAIEWIPYDRFCRIKYIAKGGFGEVYRAIWIDGYIDKWNNENQSWEREDQNMFVILKSIDNPNIAEFINEV